MTDKPWWKPRKPVEIIEKPWLHDDVIDYLAGILTLEMNVIEQGCGGSTLWIAQRVKHLVSCETDLSWYKSLVDKANEKGNVIMLLTAPGQFPTDELSYYAPFDVVFIDGEHKHGGRRVWIENARNILKPHGWLVLDNANRPEYADVQQTLPRLFTREARFDRNENGSKFFVTEFWRMK